ncbi:hypothetical protein C9439_00495 [archaeon SCG-AAA382B04]|nr:hypothetical protein C9439_00495 [archaeon SCG-AAA382B04]
MNGLFFKWLKNDWGSNKLKTNIIDLKDQIESPTLVIYGKKDRIVPFESSKNTCKLLKDCEFTPMERCGHLPQKNKPTKFNKIIKDFL